jgi:carbon monoxide dehydrogenase subunit G
MQHFSTRKTLKLAGLVTGAIALNACSDSNSDSQVQAPIAEPTPASIRGVYAAPSATGALRTGQLPSSSLPASSLPAMALPTEELDETPSVSELRTLSVLLEAQQQVGNVPTTTNPALTALAVLKVNELTGAINGTVTVDNISSDDEVTMVHIHSGFAGENGPVLAGFNKISENPTVFAINTEIDALASLPGNDLETFLDGGWYINLHTNSNPSGHLRGQVFTQEISVSRTKLQGQQENPAITNAEGVSGVGYVTVNPDESEIVANVSVEGFVPFLDAAIGPVHLHNGFAGQNGGVFLPLFPVDGSETSFRGTETDIIDSIDFARIAQGGTYINVHSAENGSGEVRGQIVPKGVTVARTELQGQQENPAVVNASGVSGVGYLTINPSAETLVAKVSVEGFVPFLNAPIGPVHLHSGFAGTNGPVLLPLFPVGDSETSFSSTEADAIADIDFEQIAKGGTYINVHSAANGSGEVRGQVLTNQVAVVRSELQTQQTVPAVTTPSSQNVGGVGYLTFDKQDPSFTPVANVTVSGFESSAVHVHRGGVAGVAGPVQIALTDVSPSDAPGTVFSATAGEIFSLQGLLNGVYYFNAHSAANPAGEIRGQILTNDLVAFKTQLTGAQVLPEANPSQATGISYITVNLNTETFNANLQVENFDPAPAFVSVNVAGDTNRVFTELADRDNGFFSTSGQVNSLQGLLNGGYSIQANEQAP